MCSRQLWFKSVSLKNWINLTYFNKPPKLLLLSKNPFFTQMIVWCANSNVLEDKNKYLMESWCSRPLKTRSDYLDLASELAPFWKFLFSYYFNLGNIYADKIWRCSQHFEWKYPQVTFGHFLGCHTIFEYDLKIGTKNFRELIGKK